MASILDTINSPQDLKALSEKDLETLAAELREFIVKTVSNTGGHVAPSLGVIELTLALHKVFNSPKDKIIWDVGHQAYAHKILTGRREKFHTLRQYKGISGFPRIAENPHDIFGVGHSSTSISVAVGLAKARDAKNYGNKVIAVIGDGALTGGMAYEGLNHAGSLQTDLIVVLNDNEMSISPNVGAMSKYLSRIITGQFYNQAKKDIEDFVHKIPRVGPKLKRLINRFEETLKGFIVPGVLFEELGFRYFGPIDGHNLPLLLETFDNLCHIKGPVLLHVITKKGKGYKPSEEHPTKFHGTGPFEIETGDSLKCSGNTYTDVFGRNMTHLAATEPNLVVITPAMTVGSGLVEFAKKFPDRFFDVGIAEQHAVTVSAGMARGGLKPVVAIYSTFLQRAFDQVIHDVCLQNQHVVFAIDRAGLVGADGATHHGVFDIGFLRMAPNMTILAPVDEIELEFMLNYALGLQGPVAIRYPRECVEGVSRSSRHEEPIELGKAQVWREGQDVAILAVGPMLYRIQEALPAIEESGLNPILVNPRFIKPLDKDMIGDLAQKGCRIVTVEEHALAGGFGSAVEEVLDANSLSETPLLRIGIPDEFIEHGTRQQLLEALKLNPDGLAERIIQFSTKPTRANP